MEGDHPATAETTRSHIHNHRRTSQLRPEAPSPSAPPAKETPASRIHRSTRFSTENLGNTETGNQRPRLSMDSPGERPPRERRNAFSTTPMQAAQDRAVLGEADKTTPARSSDQEGHSERVAAALKLAEDIKKRQSREALETVDDALPGPKPQQRKRVGTVRSSTEVHEGQLKPASRIGLVGADVRTSAIHVPQEPLEAPPPPVIAGSYEVFVEDAGNIDDPSSGSKYTRRQFDIPAYQILLSDVNQELDAEPQSDAEQPSEVAHSPQNKPDIADPEIKSDETSDLPKPRRSSRLTAAPSDRVTVPESDDQIRTPKLRRSTRVKISPPKTNREPASDESMSEFVNTQNRRRSTRLSTRIELAEPGVFAVKRISRERKGEYLVEWEDGPDGVVYPASWEPKENVGVKAVQDWEEEVAEGKEGREGQRGVSVKREGKRRVKGKM